MNTHCLICLLNQISSMSEMIKIVTGLAALLIIIYGVIITHSLRIGKDITLYVVCILLNLAVAIWFWFIASRPTDDPQAGMGLGPIILVCGLITIAIPGIALIVFICRQFIK